MLPSTHLITTFRKGKAYPYQLALKKQYLELAESMIELFNEGKQVKRAELEGEAKVFQIEGLNPKVPQGFLKLLMDRCEFAPSGVDDSAKLRNEVFTSAAEYWTTTNNLELHYDAHQQEILKQVSYPIDLDSQDIDSWLFGDILNNQKLMSFESLEAEDLIHRFNLSQFQGLLFNATHLTLTLSRESDAGFRQVMQMLKFFCLMFHVEEMDKEEIILTVDGPSSILENSRSYGVEMANFLPAILLLEVPWKLAATIKRPHQDKYFHLEITEKNSYRSHYRKRGIWANEKMVDLVERFNEKFSKEYEATIGNEVLPISNNQFLLPDFSIQEKEGGRVWKVEWIRYFSLAKLAWMKQKQKELPSNYLWAIKGKRVNFDPQMLEDLKDHLLIFQSELTAPALKKKIKDLQKKEE